MTDQEYNYFREKLIKSLGIPFKHFDPKYIQKLRKQKIKKILL